MTKYLNDVYRDRGMKKWAGFILSEHTLEQEKYEKKKRQVNLPKSQMTPEEIYEVMQKAQLKNKRIAVQREAVDMEGNYYDDVVGLLKGADSRGIYIEETRIDFDEIRHVELYFQSKWSDINDYSR